MTHSASHRIAATLSLALLLPACASAQQPSRARASQPPPVLAVRAPVNAPPQAEAGADPAGTDARLHEIVGAVSPERIERDIRALVSFGTRHTLSDTLSTTRGIGAARRWIFAEFERISQQCGGCLEVRYVSEVFPANPQGRLDRDVNIVNVIAIQRGGTDPERYVLLSGDIDSRVTDVMNATADSPGANDNASGVAATLEAARVLSRYQSDASIVYAALSGEEQGLYGGQTLARHARENGWRLEAVINNDMIGNIAGITGVVSNTTARVFAPGLHPAVERPELERILRTGGELDVPSRQLGRYIKRIADLYMPNLDVELIYRLDRFGRGGHHAPFFMQGYPAVRLMETHEHYDRQHQDLRVEDGRSYGDVIGGVDFEYAAAITALDAAVLVSIAWAPPPPTNVRIAGAVQPSTTLRWDAVQSNDLAGYRVYWRLPTDPFWTRSRWVGAATEITLENVIIDNYFFGVAAVDPLGHESLVVFPVPGR